MGSVRELRLDSLHERHQGLTQPLSDSFYEAASVCLSRHHNSPVDLKVDNSGRETTYSSPFRSPTERQLKAWGNEIDTTEAGAYCIALASIEAEDNLMAVRRAETLSGADWYVGPAGTGKDDLESCLRLEVSGVDAGNRAVISGRLNQKVRQAQNGASNLPAIASVIGFKEKSVLMRRVDKQ
jgi:hypothetical protein